MDLNSIGFLILLVAMSGVIAYYADIVGKKLGKKRLSIGGLRPRHTATLGTVLVGLMISIFTIAVVLVFSSPIRQSLLEGAKIRVQLEKDHEQLSALEQQVKDRASHNTELTKSNGILSQRIGDKTKELASRQAELQRAKGKLTELNGKIGTLQAKIGMLQTDVASKRVALQTSESKLQIATTDLKRVESDLKGNQANLKRIAIENNQIDVKNAQLVTQNDKLIATQTKLNADLEKIKLEVSGLQSAKEQSQKDLDSSQAQLKEIVAQLSDEQTKLTTTQQELHDAEVSYETMRAISGVSRKEPMIFKIGEEVVRSTVAPGLSVNAARGALTNLIRRAQAEAHRRGAQRHFYAEAAIVEHSDPQTNQVISPEMIEQDIVRQIAGSPNRKVLIATSSLNAFRGESVSLEVTVLPDPLIYIAGQMVAETVVDGSRGDSTIYDQLRTFLQDTVKSHAQKAGMIPISNSDISFGQVSQADLLQVISQLHNANRSIRLQAHAVGDTYAADPLKLEFRLR